MDASYYYLAGCAAAFLFWRLWLAVRRSREQSQRAFQRKLETVLQPRERVKAIFHQGGSRWVLTSKRLLSETKEGFTSLAISDIKTAYGANEAGNRTTVPAKMTSLTIRGPEAFTLSGSGEDFQQLAGELLTMLKKRREKAKKKA